MKTASIRIAILMPVRDDWISAAELTRRIDKSLSEIPCIAEIVIVDDGSVQECNPNDFRFEFSAIAKVVVVRLRRNVGHQRAIAIGLAHVAQKMLCDAVMVMDADGEDTAEGALLLVRAFCALDEKKVIFAERSRRSESLVFRCFYQLYKLLHRILTGVRVRVGNFSILPSKDLNTLVVVSELWNHYAAAVFRSKLPFTMIPIPRGHRIAGKSTMNYVALVGHGLSAISVFGDVVGVRLLIASLVASLAAALGILAVVVVRLFTNLAIPGWATYATGTLGIMLIQFVTIAASFTMFMLFHRTNIGFLPSQDCPLFVDEVRAIYPPPAVKQLAMERSI